MNEPALNLRDIHLPEPVSWWPLAPGWWILFAITLIIILAGYIAIKIYRSRQLRRDISSELEQIKLQFDNSQNKSQLAKSLSVLLRRANLTYNPGSNVAGLTGDSWLAWLDKTSKYSTADTQFQSDTGKILLSAPYLPDDATLDFSAKELIHLCETWLLTSHQQQTGITS